MEENPTGLGTFGGVFTPSILTILGVIMYLRYGWVVGNVGLAGTLLIVTLATLITLLTSFSISAIATDQRVRTGGAYYMISRSLGLETGGAVGIPLFFSLGLSVALYTVGFAESVVSAFPSLGEYQRTIGVVTTIGVTVLALVSAKAAIRAQYFIMAAIGVSLVSLYFGSPVEATEMEVWGAAPADSAPFWVVFAVFFPAVTGIMSGVNLSGDLKNPGRSIPRGTLLAVGVGYLIYMTLPLVLASRADAATLIADPMIMRKISFWGDAILLGVWGATLSSAVGSIMGGPRVLQALARDGVLPHWLRWLGKGSGKEDTPRYGTLVTMGIALLAVMLGDLNAIAPVITMFFLTTYCVLNVAAWLETALDSPSFRPTFRVHWAVSMLGAFGCAAVMFLINAVATVVAISLVTLVFVWLKRRDMKATWGSVGQGLWMAVVRAGLLRYDGRRPDPKNWRPHLLVLTGTPTKRWHLIELASSWSHNKALMTVATVLPEGISEERQRNMDHLITEYLADNGVQSLVCTIPASSPFDGAQRLVDAYGLGQVVPNTVMLGDTQEQANYEAFCDTIRHCHRAHRNVVIVQQRADQGFGDYRSIDVWWGGLKGNGGLMKVMAYLLQTSMRWQDAQVTIKMVVPTEEAVKGVRANVGPIVERMRTGARLEVLVSQRRAFKEVVHESSRDADIIFMGMAAPEDTEDFTAYYQDLRASMADMPTTVFFLSSGPMDFAEMLTD